MRWKQSISKGADTPKVDEFLADIEKVCRQHSMSIGHEDPQGGFIIEPLDEANLRWLHDASDGGAEDQ